ncbi:hypothetical protein JGS22_011705 [Streptomyces sp. P38-E01]|uniref:DUF5667 domain-containing protein n=1 Tax=Streptomyces tardus TaxID=2780544 RepID=A0A949JNB0_9ACTN|nr:DUF5667 domain-containing protein [Streptomyces tardus]MBU7598261.1 hypothetical protein [Streptomyces tardus]
MIPSVSTNRRANAFAQALDASARSEKELPEAAGSDPTPAEGSEAERAETGEHSLLLAVAEELGALPKPALDPEVKSVQRAQLIAAMERELAGGGQVPEQRGRSGRGAHRAEPRSAMSRLRPKSRLSKGLAAGGLTVGVAAGALGGVAAASTDALPGDRLYGLKRGMEDFKLDMADDDTARGTVHLDHASNRMHEARRLLERGRSGELDHTSVSEVRKALGAMSSNAAEGRRLLSGAHSKDGDLGPLRSLSSFADSHQETWTSMRSRLPVQLQDISDEVSSVFEAMNRDAYAVRKLAPGQPDPGTPGASPDPEDGGGPGKDDGRPSAPEGDADGRGSEDGGRGPEDDNAPDKSGPSPDASQDGLLGGGTGGLLNPPAKGDGKGSEDSPSRPSAPDITIPPLLPGGLPGLGLESERDD